ncbi:hypothetical protein [Fulvivirga kasyanovii]|uniref:hypothetical protein n=1 Tax=Fulvivirga kasyanovii TaxID=396812 RepID=UPI0031DE900E
MARKDAFSRFFYPISNNYGIEAIPNLGYMEVASGQEGHGQDVPKKEKFKKI